MDTVLNQVIFPSGGYKKLNQNGGHCLYVGRIWMVIGHERFVPLRRDDLRVTSTHAQTQPPSRGSTRPLPLSPLINASDNEVAEECASLDVRASLFRTVYSEGACVTFRPASSALPLTVTILN